MQEEASQCLCSYDHFGLSLPRKKCHCRSVLQQLVPVPFLKDCVVRMISNLGYIGTDIGDATSARDEDGVQEKASH